MRNAPFTLLLLACTALLATSALACVSARTVVTERTIDQVAFVPAPSGPHAAGAPLPADSVALEGAVTVHQVNAGLSRAEGETGHVVASTAGRGRAVIGANEHTELGVSAEYSSLSLGTPVASDTRKGDLQHRDAWRFGSQLRVHTGDARYRIGGLLELELAAIPTTRTVTETRTTYYYDDPTGDLVEGEAPDSTPEARQPSLIVRDPTRTDTDPSLTLIPQARLGFFFTTFLADTLSLTTGGLVQNQPLFFGSRRQDGTCFYDVGELTTNDCDGTRDADDIPRYRNVGIVTLFAALSVNLDPITLIAQLHGNVAGDARIIGATPMGGELVLRLSL